MLFSRDFEGIYPLTREARGGSPELNIGTELVYKEGLAVKKKVFWIQNGQRSGEIVVEVLDRCLECIGRNVSGDYCRNGSNSGSLDPSLPSYYICPNFSKKPSIPV